MEITKKDISNAMELPVTAIGAGEWGYSRRCKQRSLPSAVCERRRSDYKIDF